MQKLLEFSIYFCFLCWSSCSEVRKEPFPDYDNVFACSADYYDDDNTKDINNELDKINLHYIDAYFFIIFCPVALIETSIIIFTFIKYEEMRQAPGVRFDSRDFIK